MGRSVVEVFRGHAHSLFIQKYTNGDINTQKGDVNTQNGNINT